MECQMRLNDVLSAERLRSRELERQRDEARSEVMRLQDNDSAYDAGYQRADAAAGAVIDRLRQERDEARAQATTDGDERAERAILSAAEAYRLVQEAREQRERAEQAEARVAHFESLAKDQQTLNAAMVASLKRGLAQLEASEAERARLRQVVLDTRRNDGHWYGCWTNDGRGERCSPECALFAETLAATDRSRAPADQARREDETDGE
jgi:hypothetical protein